MKNNFYLIGISILSLSTWSMNATAQTTPRVDFTYDAAGNRKIRAYTPARLMNDTQVDEQAEEIAQQYGLGVYPNPLMDGSSVTVVLSGVEGAHIKTGEQSSDNPKEPAPIEASEAVVYVLDNTGKVLLSQKQTTSSPSQLDLSGYSAGIYHIKVAIGKEVLFYKITKMK